MICQYCGVRLPRARFGKEGPRVISHTLRCRVAEIDLAEKKKEEEKGTLRGFLK